jgi:hypothetical protein
MIRSESASRFSAWHLLLHSIAIEYPVGLFPAARFHAYDPYPPTLPREPVAKAAGFWSF